jgi:hypothetical protein
LEIELATPADLFSWWVLLLFEEIHKIFNKFITWFIAMSIVAVQGAKLLTLVMSTSFKKISWTWFYLPAVFPHFHTSSNYIFVITDNDKSSLQLK